VRIAFVGATRIACPLLTSTLARWLHSALTVVLIPARMLQLLWASREHAGWRKRLGERFAFGGEGGRGGGASRSGRAGRAGRAGRRRSARAKPGALWIHAETPGEVQVAAVLIAELRRFDPQWHYLLTHAEPEGRGAARALGVIKPADVQCWRPFDTPGATRRFFKRHRPRLGVLIEHVAAPNRMSDPISSLMPNLLHQAARFGVPMMMANARLSATDLHAALRRRALLAPGIASLALVLAQSNADAQRLAAAGAQQVRVFGNLKFDVEPPLKLVARGLEWRQKIPRAVVLAAGTREGEEDLLLHAWTALPLPRPLLVIVPRRARRIAKVAFAIRNRSLELRRRSSWPQQPDDEAMAADVWLGDTPGEMALYYGMADVALLGGSFIAEHGGQNLIEASACGCPVLLGPHVEKHENVIELALAAGCAEQVPSMAAAVARALPLATDPARATWVRNAFAFTSAHRGTVKRVVGALLTLTGGKR
jgi:3-deoxy-D-manno-octulosonic-acid transferase